MGVYLRLSSKDSVDKDSLHNQKAIIEGYLKSKPDINVFKYYIDDGVSSYKDFRPTFEEFKDPNKTDNDNIPNLDCVIKRIRIFDNKLDIEY